MANATQSTARTAGDPAALLAISLAAIVLGAIVLLLARVDPPAQPAATVGTPHVEHLAGHEVQGIPHHPAEEIATLVAILPTPDDAPTTIRSVAVAATPVATPRPASP